MLESASSNAERDAAQAADRLRSSLPD